MQEDAVPSRCSDVPAWVLLDTICRNDSCVNATTARAVTSAGWPVEVSFQLVDPPGLSRCSFHYAAPISSDSDDCRTSSARVTGADGAFVLISVRFPEPGGHDWTETEVFVYRAGPGAPSLHLIPRPYPCHLHSNYVAVISCDDDDGVLGGSHHCLVVVPERKREADGRMSYDYELQIFSTETMLWSSKVARMAHDIDAYFYVDIHPGKVFAVGGGAVAWVDMRHGVLLCDDVRREDPEMRVIQLPPLGPSNEPHLGRGSWGSMAALDQIRDVTCRDGWLRFIEIEYPELDDDNLDKLRWTCTIFKQMIGSNGSDWELCGTVDSADLSPAESCFPDLVPEIWDGEKKRLTSDRVICQFLTLDIYRDDVVYVRAKVKADDPNGWMLAVHTSNNQLERAPPFSQETAHFLRTDLQCDFSKYLSEGSIRCPY